LNQNQQFYGIFDGHMGNIASKFSASSFYDEVRESLSTVDEEIKSSNSDEKWKDRVKLNMEQSFYNLHEGILEAIASSPTGVMREAGTTATILHVTDLAVVIANVGDSRAVLSSWVYNGNEEEVTGIQLTVDHVASSPEEQDDVIERGGFISKSGGIDRVNGSLAVSRSLGDVKLAPYLSQNPHVMALTKDEVHKSCRNDQSLPTGPDHHDVPCFIIVASDGLWDVVDNQEAVKFVAQVLRESKESLQTAAQMLTQEAYVRGSSDNIGVLIVAL
jgi:serine/threonine protein phosphatase PrpC